MVYSSLAGTGSLRAREIQTNRAAVDRQRRRSGPRRPCDYNTGLMGQSERIAAWMRERVAEAEHVESWSGCLARRLALVLRLAQLAVPGTVVGLLMPCQSDPQDERDAALVAKHFSAPTIRVDLDATFDVLAQSLQASVASLPQSMHLERPPDDRVLACRSPISTQAADGHAVFRCEQPELPVAGTGNRSELSIGYFTKYGDGGVDMLPIGHLVKSQVRAMARELGVPEDIVDRTPSAGLWLGQTDEAEMGMSYAELRTVLEQGCRICRTGACDEDRAPRPWQRAQAAPAAPPTGRRVEGSSGQRVRSFDSSTFTKFGRTPATLVPPESNCWWNASHITYPPEPI